MNIASNATSSSTKPTPSYLNRTPSLRNAEIRNESTRITIARTKQRSSCAHVAKAVRGHIRSLFTGGAPAAIAAGAGIFAGIHRPQLDSTHAFWKSRIYTLIIYIMHAASLDFNLSRSLHYPFAYNTYIHTDAIVSFCIFLSFFFGLHSVFFGRGFRGTRAHACVNGGIVNFAGRESAQVYFMIWYFGIALTCGIYIRIH